MVISEAPRSDDKNTSLAMVPERPRGDDGAAGRIPLSVVITSPPPNALSRSWSWRQRCRPNPRPAHSFYSELAFFGLPAVENIHPFTSNRSQYFLREGHRLRSGLSVHGGQINCVSVGQGCCGKHVV